VDRHRIRLGIVPEMFQNIDTETLELTERALDRLRRAGVEIVTVQMPGLTDLNNQAAFPIALFEANRDISAYLLSYGTGVTLTELAAQIASPDVKGVFDTFVVPGAPQAIPDSVYNNAVGVIRPQMQQLYADTFRNNRLDALIFPTTPLPASPVVGSDETVELNGVRVPTFQTYIRNTDANAVAGVPGVSLPMALTKKGLPVGIEIDGPANSDRRLLGIALTLEKILGRLPAPPGF
jgi:Asp-tRNA(Asn)/Glu-tRNA(Gln) amidotransferase A subunit family amidase